MKMQSQKAWFTNMNGDWCCRGESPMGCGELTYKPSFLSMMVEANAEPECIVILPSMSSTPPE
jgi:hypothetical protein